MALDKENNLSGGVCSRGANRVRQELATVLRRWEEVSRGHLVEDKLYLVLSHASKKDRSLTILIHQSPLCLAAVSMFMNQTC